MTRDVHPKIRVHVYMYTAPLEALKHTDTIFILSSQVRDLSVVRVPRIFSGPACTCTRCTRLSVTSGLALDGATGRLSLGRPQRPVPTTSGTFCEDNQ